MSYACSHSPGMQLRAARERPGRLRVRIFHLRGGGSRNRPCPEPHLPPERTRRKEHVQLDVAAGNGGAGEGVALVLLVGVRSAGAALGS